MIRKRKGESDLVTCSGSLILIAGLLMFINWLATEPKKMTVNIAKPVVEAKVELKFGTMNGYDSASKTIINPINVFKDYENRNLGISGKANHGEKVTILETSDNGVKIKTASGVVGWVSNWFITED